MRRRIYRGPKIHSFKQTVELPNVTVTAGTTAFFAYSFKGTDLPQQNFFAMFDSYRIMAVKLTFYPEFNIYGPSVSNAPVLYTVADKDNANVPTSVNQLDQYEICKRSFLVKPATRYIKPQALSTSLVTTSAAFGNMSVSRKTWMDSASTSIQYFGIRGAITASNASQLSAQLVRVTAVYYMQFKSVI